jgi:hypothetical protein
MVFTEKRSVAEFHAQSGFLFLLVSILCGSASPREMLFGCWLLVVGCCFFRGDGWGWVRNFDATDKIPGSGDAGPGMTMRGGTVGWVSGIPSMDQLFEE